MGGKYLPFEDVEQLATIEQLARMLNLSAKPHGRTSQLRCSCPVHGGDETTLAISPHVRSRRGSMGVFFCQSAKSGGDRIGLVAHCMEIGQQDAAYFIAEQFGMEDGTVEGTVDSNGTVNSKSHATIPQKKEGGSQPAPFNSNDFADKLAYDDSVAAIGLSEQAAAQYRVGVRRGKLYLPICPPGATPAGFAEYHEGKLRLPDKWLNSNVVPLRQKTA